MVVRKLEKTPWLGVDVEKLFDISAPLRESDLVVVRKLRAIIVMVFISCLVEVMFFDFISIGDSQTPSQNEDRDKNAHYLHKICIVPNYIINTLFISSSKELQSCCASRDEFTV